MVNVLLVEDDLDIRRIVELALDDHNCLHAVNGREALTILGREDVDVVLLDIMMPELDGIETLREIRRNHDTSDLRVILLTARASEDDHLRGYQVGADAYLTKPFDLEELRETLQEVMQRSSSDRRRTREDEVDKATFLRQIERKFE
ncbi:MAG: response regulator [Actinobacteria bacterium]|nr:response regulator [Actinomycetota bacterium]